MKIELKSNEKATKIGLSKNNRAKNNTRTEKKNCQSQEACHLFIVGTFFV